MTTHDEPTLEHPGEPAHDEGSALTWSVGAVARRLHVSPSTLRTWERRYGLGPTDRTKGGHRRYSESDISRVELLHGLIGRGVAPRTAATLAATHDATPVAHPTPSADVHDALEAPQLFAADVFTSAARFDSVRLGRLLAAVVVEVGVIDAWDAYLQPALHHVRQAVVDGIIGLDAEHLVSDTLATELRAYVRASPDLDRSHAGVILATVDDDPHSLPVVALQAALAGRGVACHSFGARLPAGALANVIASVHPAVVSLWSSSPKEADDHVWQVSSAARADALVVLGGPGWPARMHHESAARVARPVNLAGTVDVVLARLADRTGE
ncbi:MerR family transcriptional regulator [Aeromicrobium sp. Leaf350]|uniref:MerR family transcriptional regulator n=1 Tax=Aeromicrobium sp. Leaf350 TaxID=2876565 RepID=UPI001E4BF893|nr:MerR family transcriptional regulator [Aeromicrobium sp. Leaf350]